MSGDYQIGDLSNLLQSRGKAAKPGNDTDEKLQSLFSSKPEGYTKAQQSESSTAKVKKRKQKIKNKDKSIEEEVPKKRKRKDKSDINTQVETTPEGSSPHKIEKKMSENNQKKKKLKSEQTSVPQVSHSPGFSPPAGIVHESLMNSGKKNKKRKVPMSSDSEDENVSPQKKKALSRDASGKKKGSRPRRDKMAKESDHKTVFIGNLPLTVKKKKLMNLLKDYGAIESIRYRCFAPNDPNMKKRVVAIKKNLHPDRHNCAAYVKFMTAESAKKALKCNGKKLDGFHLRVDMAARDQVRDIKKSVFVGNLPFDMEEETMRSHFADCGTIDNVRIVRDSKTSLGKGFCYINFTDTDAVSFALRLNGSRIAGREMRVMQCLPNPKKSVLERKKDKSGKASKASKQQNKKETKPQQKESEPFTVIDAGKLSDAIKLSEQEDNEETPRKISFAEKFEKKKQKRFEKVKSGKKDVDKNLSETEKLKGQKKQKEKSDLDNSRDQTFSGNKMKSKDKAGFKKLKKQKPKKTDSRTGSDRGRIFVKSPKTTGSNPPQRLKTFDDKSSGFRSNKPNVFSGNKPNAFGGKNQEQSTPNKHIKFDKPSNSVSKKTAHHTPQGSKPSGGLADTSVSKATPKHIYFD